MIPEIPRVTLGRTGLSVCRLGIGTGGPSRIGVTANIPHEESLRILSFGLRHGVNFIDTAQAYNTETLVGEAIRPFTRDDLVISTKMSVLDEDGKIIDANRARSAIETSLVNLGVDCIDIYHLHGVRPEHYTEVRDRLYPVLEECRRTGMIRFPGITELFNADPAHIMLRQALQDDIWDVVMIGYNMLNQTAQEDIFPQASERGVGTLIMFAARRALSRQEHFSKVWSEYSGELVRGWGPLQFLIDDGYVRTMSEGAYRFAASEPRADVVLCGTGKLVHLKENIDSVGKGPLAEEAVRRVYAEFAGVSSVTGE